MAPATSAFRHTLTPAALAAVLLAPAAASAATAGREPAVDAAAAARASCHFRAVASGVNIRTGPSTKRTSVGQMHKGQKLPCGPDPVIVYGGKYKKSCRSAGNAWAKVKYRKHTRYVVMSCVEQVY